MEIQELVLDGPVLAVHAHPDDETLTSGGLLATAVERGVPVTLVTCTRGERGEVIGSDPLRLEGDGPALGAYREVELAHAMAALGVSDHLFLDRVPFLLPDEVSGLALPAAVRFEDSGMAWVGSELSESSSDAQTEGSSAGDGDTASAQLPEDVPPNAFYFFDLQVAAQLLAAVIEDRQPMLVVTYEPGGGYGHPDHVRTYQVTALAVSLVEARGKVSPPTLLSAIIPADVARAGREDLETLRELGLLEAVERGGRIPDASAPLPAVASHSVDTAFRVDVTGVRSKVVAAMVEHKTQIQWATAYEATVVAQLNASCGSYGLSNMIIAPLPSAEYYAQLR